MGTDNESFNMKLYDLLKVRGYRPVPLNSQNQRVQASQAADVIEFTFKKDGKDYGKAWVSIDDAQRVIVYYDDEQEDSPSNLTPGIEYDDTWTGLLTHLKNWAMRRQLDFELSNKDRLGDDMRQRDYYKMKEKVSEGYHAMGKAKSYNDNVPNIKIVLQHNRNIEEGEQRYRNVAKIYLENVDGERILAPTNKPGVAQIYARHLAEGGQPHDERWNHLKGLCEEYNKMAGFVRATRNGEFTESAQKLVQEGINHYNKLRESLSKMRGSRGYNAYFESWSPPLMEDENDESINELFVQETMDPRIESVMPILSRLRKNVVEMSEVGVLESWADNVISEKLELDEALKDTGWMDKDEAEDGTVPAFMRKKKYDDKMKDATGGPAVRTAKNEPDEQLDEKTKPESTTDVDFDKFVAAWKFRNPDARPTAIFKDPIFIRKFGSSLYKSNTKDEMSNRLSAAKATVSEPRKDSGFGVNADTLGSALKGLLGLSEDELDENFINMDAQAVAEEDEIEEGLDKNQIDAGQLGPTEKVKHNNIGKLVGANESTEYDEEMARIMEIARFNR